MSDSATASPAKDLDIFGKELGLTAAERNVLSEAGEVFLRKVLQVDTHSKKGDPTEPRIMVISSSRCSVLTHGPSTKLETTFNFLKILHLECTDSKLIFHIAGEARSREFHSKRTDSVQIIALITAQLKSVFPVTPLELVLKLTFDPDSLRSEVSSLRDSLMSAMNRVDASSIQGFITSYGFLCDFFGIPFNNEVSWFMKHVYLSHGIRDLNMSDFNHLTFREILPMLSTLRHNQFFEGIVDKSGKLGHELFDELSYVLNVSRAIKQLVLNNSALKPENLIRLSSALKNNPRTVLTHLDLSDNAMDDKTIEALGGAIESLPHGLQMLKLVNCKITPRGGSLLAQSMKQNKNMQFTLVHLDLSSNPLGPDPQGSLAFIQEPQTIATLNLSKCSLNFEFVLPVLIRGCQQHLRDLNLSHNFGKGKRGIHSPNVAAGFQQFLSTSISIYTVNIAGCKLTSDIMTAMLEGLAVNPNVNAVDLDVSSNDLGTGKDPRHMMKVLARTKCLYQLNLSECGLDHILPEVISAVDENHKLKHIFIGKNFGGKNNIRAAALSGLSKLLNKEDCHLRSLCVTDSKLKEQTTILLEALEDNTSLTKLDISGNQMSNRGARSLAKTLHTNCSLREVRWDNNDTTLYGFRDVANALENNYTLRVMPLPLHDIGKAGKGVEEPIQKIQVLLCRNHSDERLKVELAALHRGRLLTATQQSSLVSRELVQLEDLLQWAEDVHGSSNEHVAEALEIKKQANKVVQLTDGLYSPQVESEQFEAITAQVKNLLDSFMDNIFTEHVNETSEQMVTRSAKASSVLLSEEAKKTLRSFVVSKSDRDFVLIKKAVAGRTAPEIANHVSAINLDVAANISELVVEQTLMKLERANHKLLKLKKESRSSSQTPDTKVSRNFTFRVQDDESPKKKKKRLRKPDGDDLEEVDLPKTPLDTEGPTLQHLGKARPKPARMQRSTRRGGAAPPKKPSVPTEATISEAESEEKPIPEVKPKPKEKKAVEPLLPPKPKPKEEIPAKAATEQEEVQPPPTKIEEKVKEQPPPCEESDSKPPEEAAKSEVVEEVKEEETEKETPDEKVVVEEQPAALPDTEAESLPTVDAVETVDAGIGGLGLDIDDELAKLDALQKEMETLVDEETNESENEEPANVETEKEATKESTEEEPPKTESPEMTVKDSTSPGGVPSETTGESSDKDVELPSEVVPTPEPAKTPSPEPAKKPSPELTKTPTPEAATPEPPKVPTPETEVQSTEAIVKTIPESTKVPTPEPAKKLTPEPTKTPTPEPAKKPTPEPTKTPTPEPAKKPTPEPAKKLTPKPAKTLTPEPAKKPIPEPAKTPTPEPAKKPTPEPAKKPTPEPAKKPSLEAAKIPTPEPAKKPTPEPAKKPTPEPAKKPTPEPAKKPAPEPTKVSTPEPAKKPMPKPAKKPMPKPTKVLAADAKKEEPEVQPSTAVQNGVAGDSEKKAELAKESPKPMPRPVAKPRVTHTDDKAPGEPSIEERKFSTPTKEPPPAVISEKQSTPGGRLTPETPGKTVTKKGGKEGQKHDRKKGTLSKLFGKKEKAKSPAPEELNPPTQKERVTSGDWEVVEPVPQLAATTGQEASPSPEIIRKPPPAVRSKPKGPRRAQSLDERDSERGEQQPPEPRRVPVMHTSAPMSELANVLKQGVGLPLKPSKPSQQQDSPSAPKRVVTDPPSSEEPQHKKSISGPAPKPRPKPRPSTKKAASSGDVLENVSEPLVQQSLQRSPHRSPHRSPQQAAKLHVAKDADDTLDTLV